MSANEQTSATTRALFLNNKLATILAIAPLGVWTFCHLWANLTAFRGAEDWQRAVTEHQHPVAAVVTSIIVLLPLLIHTAWGITRIFFMAPNNARYGFFGNLKYLLQRLSALGVLLFLGAHIFLAFIQPHITLQHAEPFIDLAREMRTPATLAVYLLGTLAVCYHLSNGLATAAMSLGLTTERRALRRMETFSIFIFAVMLAMAWGSIYALYTAGGGAASAKVDAPESAASTR
jgi:succinate dehydrogenase / fumarate reductase cytochrome b subunit